MKKNAMVLDLSRCIGCYACIVSCKLANVTRPGVNYNAVKAVEWDEYPNAKRRYMLTMCNHCESPACVKVCPAGATYKAVTGEVLVNYDLCIGCGYCVSACPYAERHLVKEYTQYFDGYVAPYEEEDEGRCDIVEKCTFCAPRTSNGMQPMCSMHCPGKARIFGDVNDPNSEISGYIKKHNAKKIEGTNMYYVIPEGMPTDTLPPAYKEPSLIVADKVIKDTGKAVLGVAAATLVVAGVSANIGAKKGDSHDDEK